MAEIPLTGTDYFWCRAFLLSSGGRRSVSGDDRIQNPGIKIRREHSKPNRSLFPFKHDVIILLLALKNVIKLSFILIGSRSVLPDILRRETKQDRRSCQQEQPEIQAGEKSPN